jgi:N-acetylglutamate synthase-like GNAT family acetyltransferase
MNLKSGRIEGFEGYSQFKSVKEFNTHVEMWLAVKKQEFSKGELIGLKRLVRFSVKVPGVSNAKIGTLLKAINEEYQGNGISRSTFKRMILKAKELGILTIHETTRKNGSQSSNLYSFNRFPQSEPPKAKKLNQPKETINLLKTVHGDGSLGLFYSIHDHKNRPHGHPTIPVTVLTPTTFP